MIYFLWTLLNFGLLLFFIVVCFRATKLIREKWGFFAATIFAVGLLSFIGKEDEAGTTTNNRPADFIFKTPSEIEPTTTRYTSIPAESYIGSTTNLGVLFGKEKLTGKTVAAEAGIATLGLVGGHQWQPLSISITQSTNPSEFNYLVIGSLKWKLLGLTVFTQSKVLHGVISL